MSRTRKPQPTLDSVFFSAPEQKVIRLLLSESTTTFPLRTLASRLKGVRGLGGVDGLTKVLSELQDLGLVEFVDNNRAVRLHNEAPAARTLKSLVSLCEMEGVATMLSPFSSRGILFGDRARGEAHSDSEYELFVVSDEDSHIRQLVESHPLGKSIQVTVWTQDEFHEIESKDPTLLNRLHSGIVLWGRTW